MLGGFQNNTPPLVRQRSQLFLSVGGTEGFFLAQVQGRQRKPNLGATGFSKFRDIRIIPRVWYFSGWAFVR